MMTKLMFSCIVQQMLKSLIKDFETADWAIDGTFNKDIPIRKCQLIDEDMIKHTFTVTYKREKTYMGELNDAK